MLLGDQFKFNFEAGSAFISVRMAKFGFDGSVQPQIDLAKLK